MSLADRIIPWLDDSTPVLRMRRRATEDGFDMVEFRVGCMSFDAFDLDEPFTLTTLDDDGNAVMEMETGERFEVLVYVEDAA